MKGVKSAHRGYFSHTKNNYPNFGIIKSVFIFVVQIQTMTKARYIRVSTLKQNEERQLVRQHHDEKVFIDKSFPEENLPTRKPGTGMLTEFFSDKYDLPNSFVIGDRITDVKQGKNLGCKCVWMNDGRNLGSTDITEDRHQLAEYIGIETRDWQKIYEYLKELA